MTLGDDFDHGRVDGLIPVFGGLFQGGPGLLAAGQMSPVALDLFEQVGVLAHLGDLEGVRQAGLFEKIAFFAVDDVLQGVAGGNEFENLGHDAVAAELLGGGDAVVAVQNVVFVLDLIQFDRRQGPAFAHGLFDADQPLRGYVALEFELAVEVVVAAHAADDPVQRHTADAPVDVVESALALLVFPEAFGLAIAVAQPEVLNCLYQTAHDRSPRYNSRRH